MLSPLRHERLPRGRRRHAGILAGIAVLLSLANSAASANDDDDDDDDDTKRVLTDPTPAKGWIVTLGGSFQVGPKYDGAKAFGPSFMPSLAWRRVGEPAGFSAPDDSFDYAIYDTDRFDVGVVGNYRSGRYSGSSFRLFGMRDVPWAIEAGVFAEYWVGPDRLRTRIEVRQGFNGHHGVVADLSADWVERLGSFTFAIGPRLSLGSASYMRRNFGVLPAEAALNGAIPAYKPGAGAKSVGFASSLEYTWSPSLSTTVFARYDRLVGDAGNSPLVDRLGERNQFSFGIGASYSFQVGG
ncbi:MAG: MipA/OmpV family protein [Stutzerimonas stutzeri]|nr:MAG: MipA/OmpV family protein [Stutzerimonas stutzeri]